MDNQFIFFLVVGIIAHCFILMLIINLATHADKQMKNSTKIVELLKVMAEKSGVSKQDIEEIMNKK